MDTYVFESSHGEIQITIIAADHARATQELEQQVLRLEKMGVRLFPENFNLISAY